MNRPSIHGSSTPSLVPGGNSPPGNMAANATSAPSTSRSLSDLMSDGFYLLMMLNRGQLPTNTEAFVQAVQRFLETVERNATKVGISSEDIYAAKYAFCAALDEAILSQVSTIHEAWERSPLQLRLFGENQAGERFFDRLEDLRSQGAPRLPSLEVYHYCLLMGFEGKYRLEGPEKLGYLTARLGDEIAYLKGKRAGFAPHWPPPDNIRHALRRIIPMWVPALIVLVLGLFGYWAFRVYLGNQTEQRLAVYHNLIQMPEQTAHISITLP